MLWLRVGVCFLSLFCIAIIIFQNTIFKSQKNSLKKGAMEMVNIIYFVTLIKIMPLLLLNQDSVIHMIWDFQQWFAEQILFNYFSQLHIKWKMRGICIFPGTLEIKSYNVKWKKWVSFIWCQKYFKMFLYFLKPDKPIKNRKRSDKQERVCPYTNEHYVIYLF